MGVMSNGPIMGTTRRNGARMGSVISCNTITRGWSGRTGNQESRALMTIAMLRIWNSMAMKFASNRIISTKARSVLQRWLVLYAP